MGLRFLECKVTLYSGGVVFIINPLFLSTFYAILIARLEVCLLNIALAVVINSIPKNSLVTTAK